jgi:hypothetical protein
VSNQRTNFEFQLQTSILLDDACFRLLIVSFQAPLTQSAANDLNTERNVPSELFSPSLSGAMKRTDDSSLPSISKEVKGRLDMLPMLPLFIRTRNPFSNPSCLHDPSTYVLITSSAAGPLWPRGKGAQVTQKKGRGAHRHVHLRVLLLKLHDGFPLLYGVHCLHRYTGYER